MIRPMEKPDDSASATEMLIDKNTGLPAVSIIILNFNGRIHLEKCLPSLLDLEYPKEKFEIIIVDNASEDDSVCWLRREYPDIRLVINTSNLGFAAGINAGADIANGNYFAFLNPDMRVDKKWLISLVNTLKSEKNAACSGSIVLNWNGDKVDYAGRPNDALNLCPEAAVNAEQVLKSAYDCPMLFASGGAMLINRKTFFKLGGFDRDYFMYHEDVDLGWRLWIHGYKVLRSSGSIVYHRGGASSKRLQPEFVYSLAQKYSFYTLFKNLEESHLWPIVAGVLYFLVERSQWFDNAGVPLEKSVQDFTQDLETVLRKRAVIQAKRVLSDSEIFEACKHPFGFLLQNHKYQSFIQYLSNNGISLTPSSADKKSVSLHIAGLFTHAQRFLSMKALGRQTTSYQFADILILTRMEQLARMVIPLAYRNYIRPFWYQIKNRLN